MGSIDENILIPKILAGDVQSFEEIVKRYNMMVYTLAYRVLKNREEDEELAQDVFLKVYSSLDSFNMKSKLSTWIYRITYNASINKYKSQKRKVDTIEIDDFVEFNISDLSDAQHDIHIKEKRKIINNSILKLPETDRIIITLYYYEELQIKEISEIVGLSTHNVKIKLHRSRQKLYVELKDKIGQKKIDYYEYS
ncbi:MAG TPA: RNA polymerase sigma factor [Bacteroidales bacterium]|jgi:RNA polymerase sigma-70 factor (ECF subfamily)|nr:RNA polymerase sigma factor [Bacteroidales bacterium]|tara:strand:+ start:195 stop:779 length:585 start_codon:yes stop_codon:yes gene_type:complete